MIAEVGDLSEWTGADGQYWHAHTSPNADMQYSMKLYFNSSQVYPANFSDSRLHGFPLRCIVR